MFSNEAKHALLFYEQPRTVITSLAICAVLIVALYFYLGRMTFLLWLLTAGLVIAFLQQLRKMTDRGPCIIINENGINDKRLRMGVIRWSDIEKVRMHGVSGAYFISIELLDSKQYQSRQPFYLRLANEVWRFYNVAPVHIKVAHLDVAPDELFEIILSEVEANRLRS